MVFDGFGVLYIASLFAGYGLTTPPAQDSLNFGVDHMLPAKDDRQLNTTTLHVFLREKQFESLPLSMRLGFGITRVTGQITQLEGSYEEGTLRDVTLDSPAWGAGPEVEATLRLFSRGKLSGGLDFLGSIYLYDRDFPAGGARYNGMMQAGAHLSYALSPQANLSLGYRWMHVSNGQGMKPTNPGYEASGLTLRYSNRF